MHTQNACDKWFYNAAKHGPIVGPLELGTDKVNSGSLDYHTELHCTELNLLRCPISSNKQLNFTHIPVHPSNAEATFVQSTLGRKDFRKPVMLVFIG